MNVNTDFAGAFRALAEIPGIPSKRRKCSRGAKCGQGQVIFHGAIYPVCPEGDNDTRDEVTQSQLPHSVAAVRRSQAALHKKTSRVAHVTIHNILVHKNLRHSILRQHVGIGIALWIVHEALSMDVNLPLSGADTPFPIDQEMAEMVLLLPRAQALGLIEAAKQQGLSVAQLLRRLVSRALADLAAMRASMN